MNNQRAEIIRQELESLAILREQADTIKQLENDVAITFRDNLRTLIKEITVDFFDGTKSLKAILLDFFTSLITELQEKISERLISGPLNNLLGGLLDSFFNPAGASLGGAGSIGAGSGVPGIYASGGPVRDMASGGSNLLRDRIRARLEPGEFVMRRSSARSIGLPALQYMNATGRMGSGPPIVNIVNEGAPKTSNQTTTQFDGDRYIIGVVLKDITQNGPIRQTLRGNKF